MRMPRVRVTMRGMMAAVAVFAVVLARLDFQPVYSRLWIGQRVIIHTIVVAHGPSGTNIYRKGTQCEVVGVGKVVENSPTRLQYIKVRLTEGPLKGREETFPRMSLRPWLFSPYFPFRL